MRALGLAFALITAACTVGPVGGGGGGDDGVDPAPDAATTTNLCPLPETTADTGALTALKAQRCNVSGTMGTRQWYRLSASLPGSATDIVQLELWDGQGVFTGGKVAVGTYPITGAELSYTTCGVCVRAVGDKGAAGTKLYMATGGSVQVTAVGINGAPIGATLTNLTFSEVTSTMAAVAGGCSATVAKVGISGTVMDVGIAAAAAVAAVAAAVGLARISVRRPWVIDCGPEIARRFGHEARTCSPGGTACPTQGGAAVECVNNSMICRPAAANACTPP